MNGKQRRSQIDTENVKGLLFINGGGATALLTFLPYVLNNSTYKDLAIFITVGLFLCSTGLITALIHNHLRRRCSLAYESAKPRKKFLGIGMPEPLVCHFSHLFMWSSYICFGVAIIVVFWGCLVQFNSDKENAGEKTKQHISSKKEEKTKQQKEKNNSPTNTASTAHSTGSFSPAISAGSNNQVDITYNFLNTKQINSTNELQPSYEFYYQVLKANPENADGSQNYEIGFKNITKRPLLNFQFTLHFAYPIESVKYDHRRSSAMMTGGKGLSKDKKKFHWLGNQIMEDEGWAVFILKTKNSPNIERVSTKLVGKIVGEEKIILPDPEGLNF